MLAESQQQSITIIAYGKCIIAGEHTVLRGGGAVVFPITTHSVTITYLPENTPLTLVLDDACEPALSLLFWGALDTACAKLGLSREGLQGQVSLANSIPLGRGMGFSAAFCVAITKWFVALGHVEASQLTVFATSLEDYFHGTSSGVDIVGSLSTQGVFFTGSIETVAPVTLNWQPFLGLSRSGRVSVTTHCVKAVQAYCQSQPEKAMLIDRDMQQACTMVQEALGASQGGIEQLASAIRLAQSCFVRWGLVPDEVADRIRLLEEAGALAVKMTGAGDGGYLLSLWSERPTDVAFDAVLF